MTITTAGFRLEEKAVRTLKATAAERGTTLSAIAQEALALWWSQQPESKTKGALFSDETTTEATPVATKEAPKQIAAKETGAAVPLTKPPAKKGAKSKKS